jgi:ubiquinone/menaquinone biosynthesis C-methylase UbiE
MSCFKAEKKWHLCGYTYPFYRYMLESICPKGGRILDAGCGRNGASLRKLSMSFHLVGVDIERRNVVQSKEKKVRSASYVMASLTSLPFKGEVFDATVCVDVIEHVKEKSRMFEEIARVSKRGSLFIGSTTNFLNPLLMFDCIAPKFVTKRFIGLVGEHYERHRRLAPKTLKHLLEKRKFKLSKLSIVGFPPFKAWTYQFTDRRPPLYCYLWIVFDKITKLRPLNFLKETMLFQAEKV